VEATQQSAALFIQLQIQSKPTNEAEQ